MQTFRFTGSYSINTHNSLKHKAISRFYLQLILYASFCAPYTAILLADSPEETDPDKVISIQMVNKQMKENIALDSNPQNYGRQIAFLGIKQKYLGIPGIKKHILAIEWLDE